MPRRTPASPVRGRGSRAGSAASSGAPLPAVGTVPGPVLSSGLPRALLAARRPAPPWVPRRPRPLQLSFLWLRVLPTPHPLGPGPPARVGAPPQMASIIIAKSMVSLVHDPCGARLPNRNLSLRVVHSRASHPHITEEAMRAMDCYGCPAARHRQRIFSIHGWYQHERQCRRQTPQNGLPGGPAAACTGLPVRGGPSVGSRPSSGLAGRVRAIRGTSRHAGWAFLAMLPFAACTRNPCYDAPGRPSPCPELVHAAAPCFPWPGCTVTPSRRTGPQAIQSRHPPAPLSAVGAARAWRTGCGHRSLPAVPPIGDSLGRAVHVGAAASGLQPGVGGRLLCPGGS
eukprot:jgi/Mesvir1/24262/Mv25245-RA.1